MIRRKNHIIKDNFLKFNINNTLHLFLFRKYNCSPKRYNIYIINNIIFNINSKKVSHFKDFLLYYDPNDFVRKLYFKKESLSNLKYYISFYEENNKIFPNYYCLPESKYIYWNIRQKQNILINIENINNNIEKRRQSFSTIFSSSIKRSIYNDSEFPSNSINSNGYDEIKKLIKIINENNTNINFINKTEKCLNNVSFKKKITKNEKIKKETIKLNIKNNLSSINKIKKEAKKNINENICLSDRIWHLNQTNQNSKHKRFMTNDNKDLFNICGNTKINVEKGNNSKKYLQKEKIKNLVKTMKLIYKKNNNKNAKNTIEVDNIRRNSNIKISKTSRNITYNNSIIKSFLNTININKKSNNKIINKFEPKKINPEKENNNNKGINKILTKRRKDSKINKKILNHIKTNSNFNLLTETLYKTKTYCPFISNNNSIYFNSPFLRKKLEQKLSTTESYNKLKFNTQIQKGNKKKSLIKNSLRNKRILNDIYYKKVNQTNSKIVVNNNNNKYLLNISKNNSNNLNYLNDYSTQINFNHNNKQSKNITKTNTSKTAEKSKNKKEKTKLSLLKKNYIFKNTNVKNDYHDSKKQKYGLKSRNYTSLNSININYTSIKNLKISNNMYTTINIYENSKSKSKSKNKNNNKNDLKTERTIYKIHNDTPCLDTKKIQKNTITITNGLNDYKYINKKFQSNNNYSNNLIKSSHNKTNSSIYNNSDIAFSINKTINNFNYLLNKNTFNKNTYNYYNAKNKKFRIKNIKPSLIKRIDKDYLYPQNSARLTTSSKNEGNSHIINKNNKISIINENKVNNTVRKLSNNDKTINILSNYYMSDKNSKRNQKKIKIKNFKQLIENNLNSERKEIDRNKLHAILNEKKFINKISTDN